MLDLETFLALNKPDFDGSDYDPKYDKVRLTGQMLGIWNIMKDAVGRTLREIGFLTGYPEASISSQLRNFRKEKFGGHKLIKWHRGRKENGVWVYKLIVNPSWGKQ